MFFKIFMGLMIATVVGLVGFMIVDTVGTEDQYANGRVLWSDFVPAHTNVSSSWSTVCNCMQTTTTRVPDKWSVTVSMKGQQGTLSISRALYAKIEREQRVYITYYVGRFSDETYFKDVELLE